MQIRTANMKDLDAVAALEAACFPPAEAATRQSLQERLKVFGQHFLLLTEQDTLIGFINGMVTDLPDLEDRMFEQADLHNEQGAWQMIFGLDVREQDRRHGYGARLVKAMTEHARRQGRRGLVLTCKEYRLSYYGKLGFVDEGFCGSVHGGVRWHQMRLTFGEETQR